MPRDTNDYVNRRSFLKKAAAASAVGVAGVSATSGSAAAHTGEVSPDRARADLDDADAVLGMLEADGVLGDRADLRGAIAGDAAGILAGEEGSAVVSMPGDEEKLRVVTEVDAGTLTLVVNRDQGTTLAVVDTGEGRFAYEDGVGRYDFDAMADCECVSPSILCSPEAPPGVEECCGYHDCYYLCGC